MAILLISSEARMAAWKKVFQAELPNEVIRCCPDFELEETIDIVIIAEPKTGLLEKLKNLKLIENIRRFRDRKPLLPEVDVTKGY